MIEAQHRGRGGQLARRIASDHARHEVAKALYEAVVDGLEFGPRDLPRAEDRAWLHGAIAVPLQEATNAALDILVWRIGRALDGAPNGLKERFEESHHMADLGFD
jgi:hypothetical protein